MFQAVFSSCRRTETIWQLHMMRIASGWLAVSTLFADGHELAGDAVDKINAELQTGLADLAALRSSYLTRQESIVVESLSG